MNSIEKREIKKILALMPDSNVIAIAILTSQILFDKTVAGKSPTELELRDGNWAHSRTG